MPSALFHPELGWISDDIDRDTLRHRRDVDLRGRRPILFYGDSFARCMTPRADCFEGLLERSDLADRFALLNYGVAGYGLDQVEMLIERTIDRYAALQPIVVVGIFVDDDLDRVVARIRNWPKPHLVLADGRLVPDAPAVPSLEAYLAEHPVRIRSYAWRWLLHARLLPRAFIACLSGDASDRARKEQESLRILEEIEAMLAARKLDHLYLVFQGESRVADDRAADWRDALVQDFLERAQAPFVSCAPYLRDAARHGGFPTAQYFGGEGAALDHYLPRANEVVFEALRDGIETRFETSKAGK
jgi:hypothetical protein